ncbi:hypothetical protein BFP72_09630 [Reichenbachiella sp. 5M10]|uniref:hypothetical protein n=1 Tax=unclassified Reichenbachiella TaxID=2633076 RepID=UPI000C15CF2A|nr:MULTISPECIES: hypothetical protein [unclassified Reichenbachiella]PIB35634.1 hypothetical protein BFP72_09630 [Reichenbachiella sp. 5M10]RJE72484.1 hypothetical protein BGP76_00435 [Reichenbachiella sp. MSK19-1]
MKGSKGIWAIAVGLMLWSSVLYAADLNVTSGMDIEISTNETYDNITISGGSLTIKAGAAVSVNAEVNVQGGGGLTVENGASLEWLSFGAMNLYQNVHLYGTIVLNGNLHLSATGHLVVYDGGSLVQTAGTSVNYGGVTVLSSGVASFSGNFDNKGTGNLALDGAASFDSDLINMGTVDGSGSAQVDGTTSNSGVFFGSTDPNPDCSTACSQSSLPVGFDSMELRFAGGVHTLLWSVYSETDNAFFTVEVSEEGTIYDRLVVVEGRGTSNVPKTYRHVLVSGVRGQYIRLSQTDFDGTTTVLRVLQTDAGRQEQENVALYPTWVRNRKPIHVKGAEETDSWKLVGREGQVLEHGYLDQDRVWLETQCSGVYFLIIGKHLPQKIKIGY